MEANSMETEMENSWRKLVGLLSSAVSHGSNMANDAVLRLHFRVRDLLVREEGQDLVEYALVVALIAFGGVISMKGLSTEIKTAFNTISSDLATSL
jgi:pilus assembly protein Flp/PilA